MNAKEIRGSAMPALSGPRSSTVHGIRIFSDALLLDIERVHM
jgi:hypothetical protein